MSPLAFVDIETTSLARPFSATPGEVWEVGAIVRSEDGTTRMERWLLPVTLEHADPVSLDISGFHRRHPSGNDWESNDADLDAYVDPESVGWWAKEFAALTEGAHLVGNVVSFDEERLAALLMAHDVQPAWHYHLIDVESMAAGCLSNRARVRRGLASSPEDIRRADELSAVAAPRWDSEELSAALRVPVPTDDRHTALGDALWADSARDAAQQMVTACLYDHRIIASDIAEDSPDPLILACVLADLVAYTHTRWCEALDMSEVRADAWQQLMLDVAEWRERV